MANTFRKAQWFSLGITSLVGILAIVFYLVVIPQNLAVLNTDVVTITKPSDGSVFNIGEEVTFTVIFDPAVVSGESTKFNLLISSSERIFLQEESIGIFYTTAFTVTRTFTASTVAENIVFRAEVTVDSKVYYNELSGVSVIDPTNTTTINTKSSDNASPGFELPFIIGCLVVIAILTKLRKEGE